MQAIPRRDNVITYATHQFRSLYCISQQAQKDGEGLKVGFRADQSLMQGQHGVAAGMRRGLRNEETRKPRAWQVA